MGAPSLGWDCVTQQSARVAEAERARLLYVAMTRARQRLVLSGLSPEYQIRSGAGRAIELVRPVIGSNRELAEFPSSALGESVFDASGARWFWPALARATERRSMPTKEGIPSARKLAAASKCLTELRHGASERMQRPFAATASGQAHTEAAQYEGTPRDQNRRSPTRQAARSIGTAIHRCLEGFDFAAEPAAEFQRQRAALARAVELEVAPGEQGGSLELAEQLLDRIAQGRLFARLRILANHIVARELPVLLPPLAEEDPIAYWTGTIDLLYRDPSCHEFVVVDYKTDLLSDSAELQTRADRYARQGALYQRAIREALDLPYTPRFELWFLDADRIVEPGCPPIGKISPAAANHL
jgi:ATP-dependent exoDNAse (exonuclease V) beta subunit